MSYRSPNYKYDIGNPRPDGKRNVWSMLNLREQGPEWVVVWVADSLHAALEWIKDQRGAKS